MLYIALGIAIIALLTLAVAIISGSVLAGWITVGVSTVGLLLLLLDGLRTHEGNDAQQDADVTPPPRMDIIAPDDEETGVATELADGEVELRPDIWPSGHPVHQIPGDDNRIEPPRPSEGEAPRPDIWP
jgi:hypothetical protein